VLYDEAHETALGAQKDEDEESRRYLELLVFIWWNLYIHAYLFTFYWDNRRTRMAGGTKAYEGGIGMNSKSQWR
jgi:hypothetical protein